MLSIIALFVALGGVSYGLAGRNTVASDDIINGAVKSADIKNRGVKSKDIRVGGVKATNVAKDSLGGAEIIEGTLGKVPNANNADKADNADNADNASALGGAAPSAYALVAQEAFQDATLAAGFTNLGVGFAPASFMKDTLGFVHLRGTMNCPGGENTAFTLPAGYRPAANLFAPLAVGTTGAGNLQIEADGDVRPFLADGNPHACGIDGISFRAEQ